MVARDDGVEAELGGPLQEAVELQVGVAGDAGVWGPGPAVGGDIRRNDLAVELGGEVENVMVDTQLLADPRASSTSATEQHPESDGPPHSFIVAPTTSWPSWSIKAAATDESTPPDMATRTRIRPRLLSLGLALARLALSGLALSGLALAGLALSGLALAGLALAGLALSRSCGSGSPQLGDGGGDGPQRQSTSPRPRSRGQGSGAARRAPAERCGPWPVRTWLGSIAPLAHAEPADAATP